MISLDSNAMTYWIESMGCTVGPPVNPFREEKIALARIFFWMPEESVFNLTPTVETEYEAIRDRVKLDDHASWALVFLNTVRPRPNPGTVEARAMELTQHHNGENDCRIVAEAELAGVCNLLTCDSRLLKNLRAETRGLQLKLPTEYWEQMSVKRGTCPSRVPHKSNPMSQCDWWSW